MSLSTGAKTGIAVSVIAILGVISYFIFKKIKPEQEFADNMDKWRNASGKPSQKEKDIENFKSFSKNEQDFALEISRNAVIVSGTIIKDDLSNMNQVVNDLITKISQLATKYNISEKRMSDISNIVIN